MTKPFDPIPTSFGTVGALQRQVRQLLNGLPFPSDVTVNHRPVGFCLADRHLGVLPSTLDARAWMYLQEDSGEDPVLVLPATGNGVAVYLVANLAERATIATLANAILERQLELVTASPGGMTSHWLQLSAGDTTYLEGLLAEYLHLCPACDPSWLDAFSLAIPLLPSLCRHLNPELSKCEQHKVIVLQGTSDNHLA
ncbi:MAG: hypothetical protein EOO54_26490, partial [Haliea sp.]